MSNHRSRGTKTPAKLKMAHRTINHSSRRASRKLSSSSLDSKFPPLFVFSALIFALFFAVIATLTIVAFGSHLSYFCVTFGSLWNIK